MGKVDFDPMFDNVSNRIGNYVHCKWKGIHVIKKHNKKRGASTTAQIEVQQAFKTASETWRKLPLLIKQSWKPYIAGRPLTELNLFMKENAKRQRRGDFYLLTKGNGALKLTGLVIDDTTPGVITIDFDTPSDTVNLTVILQGITDGAGNSTLIIKPDVYMGIKPVQITGLRSSAEYFLYCFTTDAAFPDSVMVSESSGFKVTVA
ncbi:MAG TPA: hypothetical protein PKG60_00785 [Spirochaetota bacterium]|mgnify:CR=1 FL=1|nr:hypothetical protein [Spirochaetota bacterium]